MQAHLNSHSPLYPPSRENQKQQWRMRVPWLPSHSQPLQGDEEVPSRASRIATNATNEHGKRWWKIRLFRGMINDVKRRAPLYWSDWSDAFDYRCIPATVYMYFAKYDPRSQNKTE